MNQYRITIVKSNTLTELLAQIIDNNNKCKKLVSMINIEGFIHGMSSLYDKNYVVKMNEDEGFVHLEVLEDKQPIAAVTMIKELKKVA